MYWLGLLSQAGDISNLHLRNALHLIGNPYGSNNLPPPHTFRILPFWPSLPFPSSSPTAPAFFHFYPFADPLTRMPSKSGPWQLDKVKRRLRQEQVAREEAASERYKQEEDRGKVLQNTNQDEQRLSLQERNVGFVIGLLSC
jgi:hypothetical protein